MHEVKRKYKWPFRFYFKNVIKYIIDLEKKNSDHYKSTG